MKHIGVAGGRHSSLQKKETILAEEQKSASLREMFSSPRWYNNVIIYEQSEWPEAQPRASNEASVLLPLSNLGRKHILMAQSEAEGPN